MYNDEFEKTFSNFLDRYEYDAVQNAIFTIARSAFEAGWLAAGGNPLSPQEVFKLVKGKEKKETVDSTQDYTEK